MIWNLDYEIIFWLSLISQGSSWNKWIFILTGFNSTTQSTIACSELTRETLEQGLKSVQS